MYGDAGDGFFPPDRGGPDGKSGSYWPAVLVRNGYLGRGVMFCPSRVTRKDGSWWNGTDGKTVLPDDDNGLWGLIDIGYNFHYLGRNAISTLGPAKNSMIRKPSQTVLAADSASQNRDGGGEAPDGCYRINSCYSPPDNGPIAWPIHANLSECNVVWVDGHVTGEHAAGRGEAGSKALYANGGPLYGLWNTDPAADTGSAWDRY